MVTKDYIYTILHYIHYITCITKIPKPCVYSSNQLFFKPLGCTHTTPTFIGETLSCCLCSYSCSKMKVMVYIVLPLYYFVSFCNAV